MKKKIILGIIIFILVISVAIGGFLIGTSINKKEEVSDKIDNNKETEKEIKDTIVISNTSNLIYELNSNFDLVWSYKVKNVSNYFNIVKVDGEYIYFTDNDKLYRRNYNTDVVEDLDIEMKDYWHFHVDGDTLIYDILFDVYKVDLTTKKQVKLDIKSNNATCLINGIVYYTNKNDNSLSAYNLENKENIVIDNYARIVEYDDNNILYVNKDDEFILYSVKDGNKEKILQEEYAMTSGLSYPIHMYKGNVYTMENDSLDLINGEKKSIYKHSLKDNEYITDFLFINENVILLHIFTEDTETVCETELCGPEGENKYYLVNIKTKEEKEILENINIMDEMYEFYNISK